MKVSELSSSEFKPYYSTYINHLSKDLSLIDGFEAGKENVIRFFEKVPKNKLLFRYEEGKWSIKEILQHLIDTERVFMYRCFRIARNDETPLQGFDQDIYIEPSGANEKELDSLLDEYTTTRRSFLSLIKSLSAKNLAFIGTASDGPMSARAAAFIILGHERHHMKIINERYL